MLECKRTIKSSQTTDYEVAITVEDLLKAIVARKRIDVPLMSHLPQDLSQVKVGIEAQFQDDLDRGDIIYLRWSDHHATEDSPELFRMHLD